MHIYKAYRLDKNKQFKTGCWLNASNDQEAKRKAAELCEEGASGVEVFRDSRRIDEIHCDE
jgi:predicted dinucleotide-binding enzyme